jgi:hypothetical protein
MSFRKELLALQKRSLRFIFILPFLLVVINSYAQSKIHGIIVDGENKGITNANVLLLQSKDSSITKGMISSKSGTYTFENIPAGKYLVASTFTGHDQVYSSLFEVTGNQDSINLGALQLRETSVQLKEVKVSAKKPLFEQKIDRMIINVAGSITSAGNTALEVLERSPGIVVDHQNNILSMNGKDGVVVMINGKINYMPITAVVQMLAGMAAGNIEKIELITTPPANLDAEGNAGYINIVLKENTQYGTNGSYFVTGGYSRGEITEAGINFNHRKGKVNFYGDYSFSRIHSQMLFSFYHKAIYQGNATETYSVAHRDYARMINNGRLGVDYELSRKTIVGALVSAYDNRWTMHSYNPGSVFIDQKKDTGFNLVNDEVNEWNNFSGNLNLQHSFNAREKLSLNLDYIYYKDNNPNTYLNSYYDGNGNFLFDQHLISGKKTPIRVWVGTADYSKKLSKKVDMEGGIKGTLSRFTNDVEVDRLLQNNWTKDKLLTNNYDLVESIYAGYASLSVAVNDKTSIKAGARYEYTNSNLGSQIQKNIVDRHYGNLFPSFFFSHTFNESNTFNISYSRRITRPTFNDLAPFVIFFDPYTFFSGNPALQPSITDAGSASYAYRKTILSFSYSYEASPITNFTPVVDPATNILTMISENQKNRKTANIGLSLPLQVTKWWTMQNNVIGTWQRLIGFYKGDAIRIEQKSANFSTSQSFKLPKEFSFEVTGFYQTAALFGISKIDAMGSLNLGLQKKFADKKSTLRFNVNNALNTLTARTSINLPDQNFVVKANLNLSYPSYKLTYTHNFGKNKLKEIRNRSTGAEEEKGRVEQ